MKQMEKLSNPNITDRLDEIQKIGHLTDKEIQWLLTAKRISRTELKIDNKRYSRARCLYKFPNYGLDA